MAYETLLVEHRGAVTVVSLNRPNVNALNRQLVTEVRALYDELAKNGTTRAVVLTGAGDKAFAAGADITEMKNLSPGGGRG